MEESTTLFMNHTIGYWLKSIHNINTESTVSNMMIESAVALDKGCLFLCLF